LKSQEKKIILPFFYTQRNQENGKLKQPEGMPSAFAAPINR